MSTKWTMVRSAAVAQALAVLLSAHALAQGAPQAGGDMDAGALARAAQNPIADMISLPFQNNTNFNYGPHSHTQNVLNIQPVVPFRLSDDWNLVTRTILPLVSQPGLAPGEGTTFGTGPTLLSLFASPTQSWNGIIWGVGPALQLPTTSDRALGSNRWGAGPTAVALTIKGPWVVGGLINNVWSSGGGTGKAYNTMTVQPFVNYNFKGGTYLSFAPIMTANWEARSGDQWTVPLGLGVGQIFKISNQPVNAQLAVYYNILRPDIGPEWNVRAQLQFLFPR
jgi:hypothetical protein